MNHNIIQVQLVTHIEISADWIRYAINNLKAKEFVHIGSDLPNENSNSNYTHHLKGATAKTKANAAQGLPEMVFHVFGAYTAC